MWFHGEILCKMKEMNIVRILRLWTTNNLNISTWVLHFYNNMSQNEWKTIKTSKYCKYKHSQKRSLEFDLEWRFEKKNGYTEESNLYRQVLSPIILKAIYIAVEKIQHEQHLVVVVVAMQSLCLSINYDSINFSNYWKSWWLNTN